MNNKAWSKKEFEERLRAKGDRYHIHHPFNVAMREGKLSREQLRGWVANRFYYQVCIPQKDAAVMANCDDRETRRRWVQRILDHDGWEGNAGGIEPGAAWVKPWALTVKCFGTSNLCCPACALPWMLM